MGKGAQNEKARLVRHVIISYDEAYRRCSHMHMCIDRRYLSLVLPGHPHTFKPVLPSASLSMRQFFFSHAHVINAFIRPFTRPKASQSCRILPPRATNLARPRPRVSIRAQTDHFSSLRSIPPMFPLLRPLVSRRIRRPRERLIPLGLLYAQ
jgi:hypothetical protein